MVEMSLKIIVATFSTTTMSPVSNVLTTILKKELFLFVVSVKKLTNILEQYLYFTKKLVTELKNNTKRFLFALNKKNKKVCLKKNLPFAHNVKCTLFIIVYLTSNEQRQKYISPRGST